MMEGQPIKFRILELFKEKGAMWTDEIVPIIQDEYNMKSNYGRDMVNFDVIELVSAGLLREISGLGESYLEDLQKKVGKR